MTDPATAAAAAVQAVSLKLPTFLASRPDVWFQQTEAQFAITDPTTQYFYLLTALDPVVAERMAGLFEFLRMPFGPKYAAQVFQRFMDQVCRGLEEFTFCTSMTSSLPAPMPRNTNITCINFSRNWQSTGWSSM